MNLGWGTGSQVLLGKGEMGRSMTLVQYVWCMASMFGEIGIDVGVGAEIRDFRKPLELVFELWKMRRQ